MQKHRNTQAETEIQKFEALVQKLDALCRILTRFYSYLYLLNMDVKLLYSRLQRLCRICHVHSGLMEPQGRVRAKCQAD